MDYRKFLAKPEAAVLPYFGGTRVDTAERRLRIDGDAEPGWWRFAISGRRATPVEVADPVELSALPAVRGHAHGGYLFSSGTEVERFALDPDSEPEPLAPCVGRRWYGGELLLDSLEFEDEAEERVRRALEDREPIAGIKGVPPALRAAFAHALVCAVGADDEILVSPRETTPHIAAVAEGGRPAARRVVDGLLARRHEHRITLAARRARPVTREGRSLAVRLDDILEAAGARLLRWRRTGAGSLEVTFGFMGERFISVVDADTLQILDAGICLSGADRALTLDSLPSAIREAIDTDQLCITRR